MKTIYLVSWYRRHAETLLALAAVLCFLAVFVGEYFGLSWLASAGTWFGVLCLGVCLIVYARS